MPEATVKDEDPVNPTQPAQLKIGTDVYTIPITASLAGGMLGFIRGSRMSALRFLAENAHRAPTTVRGWYFYNKTKNYRVLLGGFKGGGQEALRLGAVGCGWVAFEEGWKAISTQVLGIPQLSGAKEVVAGGGTAITEMGLYANPVSPVLRARISPRQMFRTLVSPIVTNYQMDFRAGLRYKRLG
ncbi:hypothetical protein FS837_005269 [Tulasnella sp. UAMH 9824]|nr:hypothetical protein FS837_005269 [Tulasnella sp. UAMH 9824]